MSAMEMKSTLPSTLVKKRDFTSFLHLCSKRLSKACAFVKYSSNSSFNSAQTQNSISLYQHFTIIVLNKVSFAIYVRCQLFHTTHTSHRHHKTGKNKSHIVVSKVTLRNCKNLINFKTSPQYTFMTDE